MVLPRIVVRSGVVVVTRAAAPAPVTAQSAWAALAARRGMTTFVEKERGEETVYMRKHDKELLEKLLKKTHEQEKSSKSQLLDILGSHKLPDDVVNKLLIWKAS